MSGSIISTTVFAIFNYMIEDKASKIYSTEFIENYDDFSLMKDIKNTGIVGVLDSFPMESKKENYELFLKIKSDFLSSQDIVMVYNHGFSIIDSDFLTNRLGKKARFGKKMTSKFVVLNPHSEILMELYNKKNNHEQGHYQKKLKKLNEVIQRYIQKYPKHDIKLFFNNDFNDVSILLMDNYVIFSGFYQNLNLGSTPHYVFKKGSKEYMNIKKDIDVLIEKCAVQKEGEIYES
jgi:hypothetical protein